MKNLKKFLSWFLFLVMSGFFLVAGTMINKPKIEKYSPGVIPERIILTWSDNTYNTQTVTWRTDTTVKRGFVQWTKATDVAQDMIDTIKVEAIVRPFKSDVNIAHYHKAKMINLEPGKKYLYRVGDGTNWSEWFQFKTAQNKASDYSFLYFGDTQTGIKSHCSRIIRQAYSSCTEAAFMLFAGDLVNDPLDNQWGEWFDCGDWIFSSVPVMAAPGNHEYIRGQLIGGLGEHWKHQFTFPENGPEGLKASVFYFDYQGVRFVILDTEGMSDGLLGSYHKQKKWLEEVLKSNPNKWSVITFHHPLFSNNKRRNNAHLRELYKPVFEKYNVDLVLQGHDHTYGRTGFMSESENKGPVYVISVAGPKMYDISLKPEMKRLATCTQLYQKIDVSDNSIQFSSYTATGTLYDQFILQKNANEEKKLIEKVPYNQPERLKLSKIASKKYNREEVKDYYEQVKQRKIKTVANTY